MDRSNIFCHIKCIKFNWLIFWPCVKTERQSSWWEGTYLTFIAYEIARVTEWWRADLFCVNSLAIMQISLYFPPPTIFRLGGAVLMCVAFPRASAQYWLIHSSRKVCDVMKQTTAVMQHQWRVWKSLSANERKAEGITVWWEGFLRIDGVARGCCCVCMCVCESLCSAYMKAGIYIQTKLRVWGCLYQTFLGCQFTAYLKVFDLVPPITFTFILFFFL